MKLQDMIVLIMDAIYRIYMNNDNSKSMIKSMDATQQQATKSDSGSQCKSKKKQCRTKKAQKTVIKRRRTVSLEKQGRPWETWMLTRQRWNIAMDVQGCATDSRHLTVNATSQYSATVTSIRITTCVTVSLIPGG